MNTTTRQRFIDRYKHRAIKFAEEISHLTTEGIPEPHLPITGRLYERCPIRIAFIGQDTRYWGNLGNFIRMAKSDPEETLFRNEAEFRCLAFTKWTNNFGSSFWDTVMQFIAAFHRISDWKYLKNRNDDDYLQSFVWAEVNSIELWNSTPAKEGADFQSWKSIKSASEVAFDSFDLFAEVFRPDIAIVMNWSAPEHYWGDSLRFETIGDHVRRAEYTPTKTNVFHLAHPNWMRGTRRSETFDCVMRTAKPNRCPYRRLPDS